MLFCPVLRNFIQLCVLTEAFWFGLRCLCVCVVRSRGQCSLFLLGMSGCSSMMCCKEDPLPMWVQWLRLKVHLCVPCPLPLVRPPTYASPTLSWWLYLFTVNPGLRQPKPSNFKFLYRCPGKSRFFVFPLNFRFSKSISAKGLPGFFLNTRFVF